MISQLSFETTWKSSNHRLFLRTSERSRQHPRATVDVLECLRCGYLWATPSFNVHRARCPQCRRKKK